MRNFFPVTQLKPHQRVIALGAVFGASYVALLVVSRIDQKMVAETLSWCALLVVATLTYVIKRLGRSAEKKNWSQAARDEAYSDKPFRTEPREMGPRESEE